MYVCKYHDLARTTNLAKHAIALQRSTGIFRQVLLEKIYKCIDMR